jgi:hypothetical protein
MTTGQRRGPEGSGSSVYPQLCESIDFVVHGFFLCILAAIGGTR